MRRSCLACLLAAAACQFAPASKLSPDAPAVTPDTPAATAFRKPITIAGAKVQGELADFPVWLSLADVDLATHARADGSDIFFTDATGSALDYQLDSWDPATPLLDAWVRLPALTGGSDTVIYVEYGDLALAAPANPPGVFRSSFLAVWHLDDTLATAAIADATGQAPGAAAGLAGSAQVAGQLGGGIAFADDPDQAITFANPLSGSEPSTFSAWVNQQQTIHNAAVVAVGNGDADQARFLYGGYGGTVTIGVGQYEDDFTPDPGVDIAGTGWVLMHWVVDGGSATTNHLYLDGAEVSGSPFQSTQPPATTGATGLIGNAPVPSFGDDCSMSGILDEVRIASTARAANWVAAEYANQSAPATFYAVGSEEAAQ